MPLMIKTESEYLEMVEKKSGALVSMACLVGAALADDKNNSPIIEKYAKNLGIAAQIDNDLCALFRWDEKNDIKTKKISLPDDV